MWEVTVEGIASACLFLTEFLVILGYAVNRGYWCEQHGCMRSLSGLIELYGPAAIFVFVVLQGGIFAMLSRFVLCRGLPSMLPNVAAMLFTGMGATVFTVNEHPKAHFMFITFYVLFTTGFTNIAALVFVTELSGPVLCLNLLCAGFLVTLAGVWGVQRQAWSSLLTIQELLWFVVLFVTFDRMAGITPRIVCSAPYF